MNGLTTNVPFRNDMVRKKSVENNAAGYVTYAQEEMYQQVQSCVGTVYFLIGTRLSGIVASISPVRSW